MTNNTESEAQKKWHRIRETNTEIHDFFFLTTSAEEAQKHFDGLNDPNSPFYKKMFDRDVQPEYIHITHIRYEDETRSRIPKLGFKRRIQTIIDEW